jgi:hypothetical protein
MKILRCVPDDVSRPMTQNDAVQRPPAAALVDVAAHRVAMGIRTPNIVPQCHSTWAEAAGQAAVDDWNTP